MLTTLFSLPRTVRLIGLISRLNDSASEMIYPLVPLYLASVRSWVWAGGSGMSSYPLSCRPWLAWAWP